MDKRVCRKCRKNRKMTEDFDHGWCNSCVVDLKLENIQLEFENKALKKFIKSMAAQFDVIVKKL